MKKKRIIWQDYLVVAALIFQWATLFMTRFVLFNIPVAIETAVQLESNPVARLIIDLQWLPMLLNIFGEGIITALYLYMRKKRMRSELEGFAFNAFVFMFFLLQSRAFANDFGMFLKMLEILAII